MKGIEDRHKTKTFRLLELNRLKSQIEALNTQISVTKYNAGLEFEREKHNVERLKEYIRDIKGNKRDLKQELMSENSTIPYLIDEIKRLKSEKETDCQKSKFFVLLLLSLVFILIVTHL